MIEAVGPEQYVECSTLKYALGAAVVSVVTYGALKLAHSVNHLFDDEG
jgi:hypothetical protein